MDATDKAADDPFRRYNADPDNFLPGVVPPLEDVLSAEALVRETLHNVFASIDQLDVRSAGKVRSVKVVAAAMVGQAQVIKNAAADYRAAKDRLARLRLA